MAFAEKKRLLELSPDKIVPNPAQPRLDFPQDELLQLAESIRQNGVLQPILVRRDRDRYVLVAGAQNHPGHCAGAFSAGRRGVGAY